MKALSNPFDDYEFEPLMFWTDITALLQKIGELFKWLFDKIK